MYLYKGQSKLFYKLINVFIQGAVKVFYKLINACSQSNCVSVMKTEEYRKFV